MNQLLWPQHTPTAPEDHILATFAFLHGTGDCFEVCGIGTDRYPKTVDGGFFDNHDLAVKAAVKLTADHQAVYLTLNPVDRALLGRANNRIKRSLDRTQDKEITVIRHLLRDIDALRPAKISSTDEEHDAGIALCNRIEAELSSHGWPEPLTGDSGNGAHLVYCLAELQNIPENAELIKRGQTGFDCCGISLFYFSELELSISLLPRQVR